MANANETKRKPLYECATLRQDTVAIGVEWKFRDGSQMRIMLEDDLSGYDCFTEMAKWPLICEATCHGIKQKVNDAAAMSRDPKTGQSASDADKMAAMRDVRERLLSGEWNAKREAGEESGSLLYRAIMRAYPAKNPEKVREWLKERSDAEKKAMLEKNPLIKKAADEIRAEKVADVEAPDLDEIGEDESEDEDEAEDGSQ